MKKLILFGFLLIQVGFVQGITVSNESPFDLYAAIYYIDKKADQISPVQTIKASQKVSFERPTFKVVPNRVLIFSVNKDDIKKELTSSQYHLLPSVAIAVGNDFFLDLDKGSLKGYNAAEWRVMLPIKKKIAGAVESLDEAVLGQFRRKNLYKYSQLPKTAIVRQSTSLPDQELAFIAQRKQKVKPALEKLLGMTLSDNEVPTITVAGSGGGFRAMLGFLGLLEGAQAEDLFDTISHASALSGSTWTLGPWYSSGWSLEEFKKRLLGKIATNLMDFKPNVSDFIDHLLMRIAFKQPITAVNIYARILAYNLLDDLPGGPFDIYLHDQQKTIQNGEKPLPIYTAISTKLPYQWVEFTPYEMGGDYFGGYIPTRAFGAPFLNGVMQYQTPLYSLAFILAICGSAFSARLSQIVDELGRKIPIKAIRESLSERSQDLPFGKFRIASAEVFNWTWGMRPLPRSQQKTIKLIDGGIWYNFGLEALYRRNPHFIIIGDYSDTKKPGDMLRRAEQDLKERGFKVPTISYEGLEKKTFAIFKDPNDKNVPVIIYFPHTAVPPESTFDPQICGPSWCSTFNFQYAADNANQLIDLAKYRVSAAMPDIKEAFKEWVEAQRKKT